MSFIPVIERRRDGLVNTLPDLTFLANGAANGSIPDYQAAAWLMAAYLNPLSLQETADLTQAMADSGEKVDLSGLPKPWVDKHSTGGVGDKTTLVLAPLLASCGLTIVKMSGRGLGITGGTVDKLSSIPGFRLDLSPAELKTQAGRIGIALTGQTPNLAPADKALYALRDVTGTVASVPLIVSSILSKKIAGGAETIVLDVKCGSGGFMPNLAAARELASALVDVGTRCGLLVRLAITDMSQPLGESIGNALEVQEAMAILQSSEASANSARFRELCLNLAAHTLDASGQAEDLGDGLAKARSALESGNAWQLAQTWIVAQGGRLEEFAVDARVSVDIFSDSDGWIREIHAGKVGQAVLDLGGGRKTKDDVIDLHVGVQIPNPVGTQVKKGDLLARVLAKTASDAEAGQARVREAIVVSSAPCPPVTSILEVH